MGERILLYTGRKLEKKLHGWGFHELMFTQPHIAVNEAKQMGLLVNVNALTMPSTLVLELFTGNSNLDRDRWWRALRLLEEISTLNPTDFQSLYPASALNPTYDEEELGEVIGLKVGESKYRQILKSRFPLGS